MMKKAIRLENAMPITVSILMRRRVAPACE